MITSDLAISIVSSVIRVGTLTRDVYNQYSEEKPILLPDTAMPDGNMLPDLHAAHRDNDKFRKAVSKGTPGGLLWNDGQPAQEDLKSLWLIKYHAEQEALIASNGKHPPPSINAGSIVGGVLVAQWAKGDGPPKPWARLLVGLADVGLEFISVNPKLLGVGGDGEKLIGAIAEAISSAIPNDVNAGTFGPKEAFAERLGSLVLRSTLSVLSEQPELVADKDHVQELMKAALPHVVEKLPTDASKRANWRAVMDALAGPAVSSALRSVAKNQEDFLGSSVASDKAAGLMVSATLENIADTGLRNIFSDASLKTLVDSVIRTAAENPEIVFGAVINQDLNDPENLNTAREAALKAFSVVTKSLAEGEKLFGENFVISVSVSAIDLTRSILSNNKKNTAGWNDVGVLVTDKLLVGFKGGLGTDGLKASVFSEKTLADLGRTILQEVVKNPQLVTTSHAKNLEGVVRAVASAIAADDDLLLTIDDWKEVARIAAQEAAMNPGRLFGLKSDSHAGETAASIISNLIRSAAIDKGNEQEGFGAVFRGSVLREALVIALRSIAAHPKVPTLNIDSVAGLIVAIQNAAAQRETMFGGKEALRLFRSFLPQVIEQGTLPRITNELIDQVLGRRNLVQ